MARKKITKSVNVAFRNMTTQQLERELSIIQRKMQNLEIALNLDKIRHETSPKWVLYRAYKVQLQEYLKIPF